MALDKVMLLEILKDEQAVRGIEVGVGDGLSCEALLDAFPGLIMWGVDPYQTWTRAELVGSWSADWETRMRGMAERLKRFNGRFTLMRRTSRKALRYFDPLKYDFVIVDANRKYEEYEFDVRRWWTRVRPGGLLIGQGWGEEGRWPYVHQVVARFAEDADVEVRHGFKNADVMAHLGEMWWLRKKFPDSKS